jgi:hypothetical protein
MDKHLGTTARRFTRVAMFSAIRGLAQTCGAALLPWVMWWIHNR